MRDYRGKGTGHLFLLSQLTRIKQFITASHQFNKNNNIVIKKIHK